ncbi:MAG: SPOR domain-containing protein [Rhodospirillum sp.]|nr:SPOR domain-containing protein [Rhodospirillum sp.]MCF8490315.1 SPOR domain-containing protein [Rhodospirillum sp.]MCF8500155.1 SPOR domain-containing protein [Rhodospirillum sp.]
MALRRQRSDGGEDDIDLDEQLLNLLPDELRDSDEIYLDDEVEPPRGKGGILAVMFGIFFGLLVAGVAAWYLLGGAGGDVAQTPGGPPVVTAEGEPYKTRPEEPGGMMVENKDKLVYNRIAEGDGAVKPVEKLLPEAEQPRTPPAIPTAPPLSPSDSAPVAAKLPPLVGGTPLNPPRSPVETDTTPPPSPPTPRPVEDDSAAASSQTARKPPTPVELTGSPTTKPEPATPTPAPEPVAPIPAQAAAKPVSPPAPAAVSTTGAKGDTLVQVAALRSEAAAEEAWRGIQSKNKELLGGFPHQIVRADLGDKGIYFRLRVGPVGDQTQAKSLCETLKSRGQGCIVVR